MARRRGKRSLTGRMLHHMKPNRVAARFISGGRHQTFTSIVKSPTKAKTVHTPKTGQHAYQQRMARERKAAAAQAAKARKQAAADQKAARAQQRKQQPRAPRTRQAPVAVNARTGKPITYAQAQAAVRAAEREARRIEAELAGKKPARKRAAKAAPAQKTPLQRAIEDVQKGRQRPAAKKAATKRTTSPRKSSGRRVTPIAPVPAGTAPVPLQHPGRNLTGVAMAMSCECHGTGRIAVYDKGALAGTRSCPVHGRGGKGRGAKKRSMRGAIRESGLPGLAARLERKRTSRRGNADERQRKAHEQAAKQVRYAGPTRKCGQCENSSGIADKRIIDRLRDQHIREERAHHAQLIRLAQAHNAEVDAAGEGKRMKVPKMPSEEKFRKWAREKYPYDFCSSCKGLGRIHASVNTPGTSADQFPVAQWRADAGLRKGRRLTARERATGKRLTGHAARVERRRKLPRL